MKNGTLLLMAILVLCAFSAGVLTGLVIITPQRVAKEMQNNTDIDTTIKIRGEEDAHIDESREAARMLKEYDQIKKFQDSSVRANLKHRP